MKVVHRSPDETLILAPTAANRGLGIFLIFLGLVGSFPVWFMIRAWTSVVPRTRSDWYPAFGAALVLTFLGVVLALHSRKKIVVRPDGVHVHDGLFRKSLHFRWTGTPSIRLQHVERGEGLRRHVTWLVKMVAEKFEYTVDERVDQQLESRAVGEAMAKTLHCALIERSEDGNKIEIDPDDLDLPFRERVKKYPALRGKSLPRPTGIPIRGQILDGGRIAKLSWTLVGPAFMLDLLVVGVVFFVLAALPEAHNQPSLWEAARNTGDYSLYAWVYGVIILALLLTSGLRMHLRLTPDQIRLTETIFGLPFKSRSLPNNEVEEVHLFYAVRGPTVQIVADHGMLSFRVSDAELAGWLAFRIRCYLINNRADDEGDSCPELTDGATETPPLQ